MGEKLKVYSLEHLLRNKRTFRTAPAAKLGDVLAGWYEKEVRKPADRLDGVAELWMAHCPPAILPHTRLVGLVRGTLTVSADSSVVRAQLDGVLRQGLAKQLQALAKGAVYRVKTVVATPIREVS